MALFMRTRSDRFNILICFLRPEHKTSQDSLRAAGTSGQSGADRQGGQTQSFLMYLRLNSPAMSSITSAHTAATSPSTPPSPITPMTKHDRGEEVRV